MASISANVSAAMLWMEFSVIGTISLCAHMTIAPLLRSGSTGSTGSTISILCSHTSDK